MANDWITLAQASDILERSEDEVGEFLAADGVETLSAGDVDGPIRLVPRQYVEKKREELEREAKRREARRRNSRKSPDDDEAESVDVEAVDHEDLPPDHPLTQVVTDRYKAVTEALHRSGNSKALEENLVQIKDAFELTSNAIVQMRDSHEQTASSVSGALVHQRQVLENLLTALQSAGQNTAAVLQYQRDFVKAIERLPEPLQSIQDVQLGLIELEEQRQTLEKERTRFEETDVGRLVTMLLYVLLIAALIGFMSIGWAVIEQIPSLLETLRGSSHRVSLDVWGFFA